MSESKCAHCNGSGKEAQVYDEQTGWSDEKACDTCNGSGRITTVEQYLKTLPANWHEDSGLATWFPLVAEEIERLRARIAELEGLLHDLLLLDESIGDRLRLPHGWSDEDKRRHALELTAREQKQTDARKAIGL
jgi:hypothetical protein